MSNANLVFELPIWSDEKGFAFIIYIVQLGDCFTNVWYSKNFAIDICKNGSASFYKIL